jgi:hypothetical protein
VPSRGGAHGHQAVDALLPARTALAERDHVGKHDTALPVDGFEDEFGISDGRQKNRTP